MHIYSQIQQVSKHMKGLQSQPLALELIPITPRFEKCKIVFKTLIFLLSDLQYVYNLWLINVSV